MPIANHFIPNADLNPSHHSQPHLFHPDWVSGFHCHRDFGLSTTSINYAERRVLCAAELMHLLTMAHQELPPALVDLAKKDGRFRVGSGRGGGGGSRGRGRGGRRRQVGGAGLGFQVDAADGVSRAQLPSASLAAHVPRAQLQKMSYSKDCRPRLTVLQHIVQRVRTCRRRLASPQKRRWDLLLRKQQSHSAPSAQQ